MKNYFVNSDTPLSGSTKHTSDNGAEYYIMVMAIHVFPFTPEISSQNLQTSNTFKKRVLEQFHHLQIQATIPFSNVWHG